MKLFLKENKVLIIVYLIMLILVGLGVNEYNKEYGYEKRVEQKKLYIKRCQEVDFSTMTLEEQELMTRTCEKNKNEEVQMDDTITTFFGILNTKAVHYISFIVPLFVIICSIKKWSSYLRNSKNSLTKEEFMKNVLKVYKQIITFIGFIFLIFVISFIISRHFDYSQVINIQDFYQHLPFSLIMFFLVLVMNYGFYINIAIISTKYSNKPITCILISYFLWLLIAIFLSIILGIFIFDNLLRIKIGETFNIVNLYNMNCFKDVLLQLVISVILFMVSYILLLCIYRYKKVDKNTKRNILI